MRGVQCDPGPGPVLPVHGLHGDQTGPRHSGPDETQSGLPGWSHGSVILCQYYIFLCFLTVFVPNVSKKTTKDQKVFKTKIE